MILKISEVGKLQLKEIRDHAFIILMYCVLAVVIVVLSLSEIREKNETNAILNNPSFVGEVIGREVRHVRGMTFMSEFRQHRLHIIGEFIEDNEIIKVDRIFIVSLELFNQFDEGDIISYGAFEC